MPFWNRRRLIFLGSFGIISILSSYSLFNKEKVHNMDMKIKILQSLQDFFSNNNINTDFFLIKRNGADRYDDESGLSFERRDNNDQLTVYNIEIDNEKSVKLPKARVIFPDVEAGYIIGFLIYLPTENLNLDEALSLATDCAAQFAAANYERIYLHKRPITLSTIAEYGLYSDIHSKWRCPLKGVRENSYFDCQIEVTSSAGNIGSTMPPAAAFVTSSDKSKVVYMLRIRATIAGELYDELRKLKRARRGGPDKYIPLRDWYNDPDWRPEGWDGKYI